ncbi:MAG: BON domain-containing protein [Caldimonas sp.]
MNLRALLLAALSTSLPCATCLAQSGEELRNWFEDPFFQISSALADCPLPAGPFVSESDKRVQAHRRAEKGTTCWLAKECDRPNAYAYDQDIAAALRQAAAGSEALAGTTLWATVQGRVLYIEGCALQDSAVARIEALARSLPHVEQAIAIVRTDAASPAPYKLRSP